LILPIPFIIPKTKNTTIVIYIGYNNVVFLCFIMSLNGDHNNKTTNKIAYKKHFFMVQNK